MILTHMGMTIYYSFTFDAGTPERMNELVDRIHQIALDLPFDEVGDVRRFDGDEAPVTASAYIKPTWFHDTAMGVSVVPERCAMFNIMPARGSESLAVGLAAYPRRIEVTYDPREDKRFLTEVTDNGTTWRFDDQLFARWSEESGLDVVDPDDLSERRVIETGLDGWRWNSFCKTQYASNPKLGGLRNFVRGHVSAITLLERIAELPDVMCMDIEDEGRFGPSRDADDGRAAIKEQPATHSVAVLCESVARHNAMVAGVVGALNDVLRSNGLESVAPITDFPDFEALEFRGASDERLAAFLNQFKQTREE